MSVHDVPRGRWAEVLAQFSRAHHGWLTRVTRVGRGPELLSSTDWQPLDSIALAPAGAPVAQIRVCFWNAPPVSVGAPRALAVDRRGGGPERALEIDGGGGGVVRGGFRAPGVTSSVRPGGAEPVSAVRVSPDRPSCRESDR